ncbi:uncharacterized protein LOC116663365 [Camelus ferus]|uniref:Uncharacterized protein LOC116663365 n=1 Tax=Camelus ferus TaxID=419612 RepID=A0A8B8SY95_CAMFR|nr:uncharacterized protein LOC116663365 [Camelus ferus]
MTPPGQPAGGARVRGGNRVSWFPGRPSPTCFKPRQLERARTGPRRCCCAPAKLAGIKSTSGEGGGERESKPPTAAGARLPGPAPRREFPRILRGGQGGGASPKWTRGRRPRAALSTATAAWAAGTPWGISAREHFLLLASPPGTRKHEASGALLDLPRLCFGPGCAEPLRRLNAVGSRKPKALATRLVSPGTKPEVVAADLWAVTSSPSEQLARRFSIEVMRIRLVPRALQGPSPLSVPRRGVGGAIARRECLRATPKQEALLFQEHAEKIIDRMCLPALSAGLRPEEPLSPGHTELPPVAFRRLLGLDRAVLAPRPPRPQRALAVTVNWAFSEFLCGFSRPRGGLLLASLNCFSRPENPQKLHWQKEPSWHGVTAKASSSERVSFP